MCQLMMCEGSWPFSVYSSLSSDRSCRRIQDPEWRSAFCDRSCFARGIERALLARKMKVLSAAPEFDSFQTVNREVTGLGFTNKYNTVLDS